MARSVSTTIIEAMNAQTTGEAFLYLLEVTHSAFDPVRVVNNTEEITSDGNVYLPFPFSIILPPEDDEIRPLLRVAFDNVSQEIINELRTVAGLNERIKGTVKVIVASDPDDIIASWENFNMENVRYTDSIVTFDLTLENFLSEPFPSASFTPARFPGLF